MPRILLLLALLAPTLLLAPAAASAAANHHVMIANFAFSNPALTVRPGDTVTWTNHDQAPHDVVSSSGPAVVRSPMLDSGQSFTFAFTEPGTYALYCGVHPEMRAQVVVLAPDPPAPAPAQQPAPVQQPPAQQQPEPTTTTAEPVPTTTEAPESIAAAPNQPVQANTQQAAPRVEQRLDPMLLVAGVVAAIAVLCLMLIGARPEEP